MKKKYRELLDKLYKNDNASLQKMGRPRLQFPKLKIPTRLDQEIRPIATPEQKKMHATAVTNQLYRDFFEEKNINDPAKRKLYGPKKQSDVKSVMRTYGAGNQMGNIIISPKSKKAFGAALVGKEYSKYDPAAKEISNERLGQKQKKFEQEYGEWKKKIDSLPKGSTEYWNTLAEKPKIPKKTTAKIDTKKLSPEAQVERGRAQDMITEHEAAHLAFHHIRANYPEKYDGIMDHLLESFHPEVLSALVQSTKGRYNPRSPHFKEEIVNHARDILSSKKMRDAFLRDVSKNPKAIKFLKQKHNLPEEASAYIPSILKDIKSGWNEVTKRSKKITPNFVKKSLGKSAKYPKDDMRGITTRKLKELSENNNPFYNPDTGLELVPEHAEAELARRYDKKGEKELARYKKGLKPSTKPPENPEDWFGKDETNKALSSAPKVNLNPEHGKIVADAYENMKHDPNHPHVKAAYNALINETAKQYQNLLNQGFKFTKISDPSKYPYKNSAEMHHDIEHSKHLAYFPTESGFGSENDTPKDHPLLGQSSFLDSEGKPMLHNDIIRQVHDINGHFKGGKTSFGPRGEHQSYLNHKKMYSPLAQKALATELMGQNSFVNFGPHGEHNRANPKDTIFAPQKAGLLPDTIINGKWHE